MKTLTISLADIEGVPFGSPETRTFADVEVRYTGPIALTDGTVIPQLVKSERLPNTGTVEFEVYASDDPQVATEYHGFAIVVEAEVRRTVGFRKKATFRRTVKVAEFSPDTVALGSLPPAEGLPAQWTSVAEILNEVGDSVATQLADPTSDAHAAILNQVGLVADDQVVTVVNDETSDAHAAIVAQAGQTMTTEINDTSSAAHAALVAEAGQITDPQIASAISTDGSDTAAALSATTDPIVAADIDDRMSATAGQLEARRAFTYATDYGAVGDGTADDTAAIQAALDTGKNVILPAGDFLVSGLTLNTSGQRLAGWSRISTTLISSSGDVLTTKATGHVRSLEILDLTVDSRGGGGHCLNIPYGISQSMIQRVDFLQRNDGKSVLRCNRTGQTGGGLFDVKFTDFRFSMPGTSTVPGVHITGDSNPVSACLWQRGRIEGGGTYLVHLEAGQGAASSAYDNAFDSINFEFADHGAMKILSCTNIHLSKIGFFDNGTIDTDLIVIGHAGSAPIPRGVNINSLHRSGGTMTAGVVDVRLESPMGSGNVISAVAATTAAGMILDVGDADVFLSGIDSNVTVQSSQDASRTSRVTIAGTPIITGPDEPEGVVPAPDGAIYLRTSGAASGHLYFKDTGAGSADGWRTASNPAAQNATNLGDAGHPINTAAKTRGRPVFNNSAGQPLWASNDAPTDPWVDATGAAVITPT